MGAQPDTNSPTPPRDQWPEAPPHSNDGRLLTDLVLTVFRLNGELLEAAQQMAAEGDITAAWWQVLGGVPDEPRSVAEIGRIMGMSRQAVQRIADILVDRGLAEYRPNPTHRRAKLLARTEAGNFALRRISFAQHPWTDALGRQIGSERLRATLEVLQQLVGLVEQQPPQSGQPRPPAA
jgi:DNA-binding MarR family transcriptional regulator